jgi:hypothetical protein
MRLAVFSVLRNEADIVGAFLRHILSLFDYAVLVDHRSVGGSGDMLRMACHARPGWRCWRGEYEGHHHKHAVTLGMQRLFEDTDADFVCLLDADEFIDVPDRASLEQMLTALEAPELVGQLFWRNSCRRNSGGTGWKSGICSGFRRSGRNFPNLLYRGRSGSVATVRFG